MGDGNYRNHRFPTKFFPVLMRFLKTNSNMKRGLVAVVVFFGMFLAMPLLAQENTSIANTCSGTSVGCWFAWLLGSGLSWIVYGLGYLLSWAVGALVYVSQFNHFVDAPAVELGWSVIRDIANMFFVLLLLIISFGTILHLEQYQLKKLLPKVLLMAVLVNFSKVIAGLFIDFSQVVMLTFVAAYREVGPGNLLRVLNLEGISDFRQVATGDSPPPGITPVGILASYMFGLIIVSISLVVVLALMIILVIRMVALWILVVFSPFAYVLSVVPMGQKYASMWWEQFSKYLIVGPVMAFLLWLSLASLTQFNETYLKPDPRLQSSLQGQDPQGAFSGNAVPNATPTELVSGSADRMIGYVVSVAMLLMSLVFAQSIGGAVGKVGGAAYSRLATAGSKTLRGATYFPREYGKRVGYATASGALGVVGRVPVLSRIGGIGNAALVQREKLRQKRLEGEKGYASALGSMRESDLRVMQRRQETSARILKPGGRVERALGKVGANVGGFAGRLANRMGIDAGSTSSWFTGGAAAGLGAANFLRGALSTEAGRNLDRQITRQTLKRMQITPPINNETRPLLEKRQSAIETQRRLKKKGKSNWTAEETKQFETAEIQEREANEQLLQATVARKRAMVLRARRQAGHKVDFEGNDLAVDGDYLTDVNAFMKRNPESIPNDPRLVTEMGPLYHREIAPDEQIYYLERMKGSDFASWGPGQWGNSELMTKAMKASPLAAVKNQLEQVSKEGGKMSVDDVKKVVSSQFSWAHTQQKSNPKLGNLMRGTFEKVLANGDVQKDIDEVSAMFGLKKEDVQKAYAEGFRPKGSVTFEGEGGAPTQPDIYRQRFEATEQDLYAKYGREYGSAPEYQANPGKYMAPDEFEEEQRLFIEREAARQRFAAQTQEHNPRGPEDAIAQAEAARAGNHPTFAEASVFVDGEELGLDAAARSYDRDDNKEELAKVIPAIIAQYKDRGYSDEQLQRLEGALNMAQNISVVDENRSPRAQQQSLAHERAHTIARSAPAVVNSVWDALTPDEQQNTARQIRSLWGPKLSDQQVKEEYFAESAANETEWKHEQGIRFTDRAREAWEGAGAPARGELTAPDIEPSSEALAQAMAAVSPAGIAPEDIEGLKQSIDELKGQIGNLGIGNVGKDVGQAVRAAVANRSSDGAQLSGQLSTIARAATASKRGIDRLRDAVKKRTQIEETPRENQAA